VSNEERKGIKTQMSGITSDSEKSKQRESSSAIERIKTMAEHWYETANDEFGFGVINGLRLALDVLEGRK
jgi:hypothetical protein